ncbi:DNA repair protein RAD57 [Diaporthe helianthi]|uniref:DNA repair protein RAD57 n=1 Tax=Diaporthe helianthi TaxID=158607 RepID=A0A2P5I7G1_DIAHE|nr:DNA repair protein RAD57 [Diaporthe helianthi]
MTDLARILPHFPTSQYANLMPSLEKHQVTTSELLTLEAADIGKRTQLPLLDVKRLCGAILTALHADLGVENGERGAAPLAERDSRAGTRDDEASKQQPQPQPQQHQHQHQHQHQWSKISTLDPAIDKLLDGGVRTGHITELVGEAGAGKTQFLLALLLAVQLPPPHGTGRNALYISTEASLSTRRLTQMLNNNPIFRSKDIPFSERPSLDNIISTTTPDLESQEHIITYQVPVEVERRNIGLIVLDSVAANYRAEFDRSVRNHSAALGSAAGEGGSRSVGQNMGARSAELVRLGMLLRDLARSHNIAVVVSNQVADRFDRAGTPALPKNPPPPPPPPPGYSRNAASGGRAGPPMRHHESSPLTARGKNPNQLPLPHVEPTSSMADALPPSSMSYGDNGEDEPSPERRPSPPPPPPPPNDDISRLPAPPALNFDHQQRWFTGWGDEPWPSSTHSLKTPSLGLVWATQVACRIALVKAPRYGKARYHIDDDAGGTGTPTLKTWRRWMKIVFAPHLAATGPGLDGGAEFEINMGGLKGLVR